MKTNNMLKGESLILTIQELHKDEVTLLKLDGQEVQVPIHTHARNGRSFTVTDLISVAKEVLGERYATAQALITYRGRRLPMFQPLSLLHLPDKPSAEWTSCVFCLEELPWLAQRGSGPAPFCGFCGDAPSWHCGLCCPYNDNGRNPIRMEVGVD